MCEGHILKISLFVVDDVMVLILKQVTLLRQWELYDMWLHLVGNADSSILII